jgi:hypothetical protein
MPPLPELAVTAGHGNASPCRAAFGLRPRPLRRIEHRIGKPHQGPRARIPAGHLAQGLEARQRRTHAHGLPFDEAGGVPIGADVLELGDWSCWLFGHQQVKRQRGSMPAGMARVLDHLLDRSDQSRIEIIGKPEIEQHRLAALRRLPQRLDVEAAAEGGNPRRHPSDRSRNARARDPVDTGRSRWRGSCQRPLGDRRRHSDYRLDRVRQPPVSPPEWRGFGSWPNLALELPMRRVRRSTHEREKAWAQPSSTTNLQVEFRLRKEWAITGVAGHCGAPPDISC